MKTTLTSKHLLVITLSLLGAFFIGLAGVNAADATERSASPSNNFLTDAAGAYRLSEGPCASLRLKVSTQSNSLAILDLDDSAEPLNAIVSFERIDGQTTTHGSEMGSASQYRT